MSISDIINELNRFSITDMKYSRVLVSLACAYLLALYIHFVYRRVTKGTYYNKNYGITLIVMSVITSGIVLTMQTNLFISLGTIGALSIVRFRTPLKDPVDLCFLFWSIGNGIICGVGLYVIAVLMSAVTTIGIILFRFLPAVKHTYLLSVNFPGIEYEDAVLEKIKEQTTSFTVRSKNINRESANYIVEIQPKDKDSIVREVSKLDFLSSVTLLENDVDTKY